MMKDQYNHYIITAWRKLVSQQVTIKMKTGSKFTPKYNAPTVQGSDRCKEHFGTASCLSAFNNLRGTLVTIRFSNVSNMFVRYVFIPPFRHTFHLECVWFKLSSFWVADWAEK